MSSTAPASGTPDTATIPAGQTASYTLSLAGTAGFNGTVSLACSGAPQASTCSISPNSLALSGTTPATATVSLTTTARAFVLPNVRPPGPPLNLSLRVALPWLLVLLTLALLASSLQQQAGLRRRAWVGLAGVLLLAALSVACGRSASAPPPPIGTPAGTYTLRVTATSGGVSHNITLTLTVR